MVRVIVSLGDGPFTEALMDLLDCAGGIEASVLLHHDNRTGAEFEPSPDVVVTDPETMSSMGPGFPEGARILFVCDEDEEAHRYIDGRQVCGVIRKGSSGLVIQTAIKAVAMGVVWGEGAPGGVDGLASRPWARCGPNA